MLTGGLILFGVVIGWLVALWAFASRLHLGHHSDLVFCAVLAAIAAFGFAYVDGLWTGLLGLGIGIAGFTAFVQGAGRITREAIR